MRAPFIVSALTEIILVLVAYILYQHTHNDFYQVWGTVTIGMLMKDITYIISPPRYGK